MRSSTVIAGRELCLADFKCATKRHAHDSLLFSTADAGYFRGCRIAIFYASPTVLFSADAALPIRERHTAAIASA